MRITQKDAGASTTFGANNITKGGAGASKGRPGIPDSTTVMQPKPSQKLGISSPLGNPPRSINKK